MRLVKSSEKLAEEFGVVITHKLDIRESLIISELVEDTLHHVCYKVIVGEMKQRSPHCGTIILKRSKFS